MKGYKLATWVGAAAIILAACGDDPVEPAITSNDGGTGTQTMSVTADIDAENVPGGFVTDFDVSLRDDQGNSISGATVTIVNGTLGTINLLEDGAGSGDYTATRNTFAPGDYRLDVTKDADEVRGVIVGGIDQHSIVSPAAGDTLPANQAFMVTWSRTAQAAGADVETRDFVAEGVIDSGSYEVPLDFVQPRTDERVRIERFNRVDIAGGLFGSRLKLSISNTVEPIVIQ